MDGRLRVLANHLFVHGEMAVTIGRHLGQVGDAQHLVRGGQPPQLLAHHIAAAPADADINLIEDERGRLIGRGEDGLERQHDARRLAAGGDLGQRLERLAGIGRDQELHPVNAGRVEGVAARPEPRHWLRSRRRPPWRW